jgi:hypothetical protein
MVSFAITEQKNGSTKIGIFCENSCFKIFLGYNPNRASDGIGIKESFIRGLYFISFYAFQLTGARSLKY